MVLGARLRTVMSSIIRWRKAEILPAGGTEYAEGLLLLMRATVMENPVERHVGDSGNQVGVTTRRSWQPNATRRVSTLRNNARTGKGSTSASTTSTVRMPNFSVFQRSETQGRFPLLIQQEDEPRRPHFVAM